VQDVGLLFCSNMAASIAAIGLAAGASTPEIMGTALTWLAISTVFVGICTMLVGRYKLATLVQYMPLPVVGACAAHGSNLKVKPDGTTLALTRVC